MPPMTLVAAAVLLFLVMDPIGNVPFYLSALSRVPSGRVVRVVVRELLIALVVLVLFLFAGRHILGLLGISGPALTVAGGVVLFLIALRMIFPRREGQGEDLDGEPFIVPLAIPYVAGPSSMTTLILIMSREPERWPIWLAALGIAWGLTALILVFASHLRDALGRRALIAAERLMGMVLIAIAIQMLLDGLIEAWAGV